MIYGPYLPFTEHFKGHPHHHVAETKLFRCKSFLQPCLAAGLLMISLGWTENYGSQTGSLVEKYRRGKFNGDFLTFPLSREGATSIFESPTILRLGIVQALVEVGDQPCLNLLSFNFPTVYYTQWVK